MADLYLNFYFVNFTPLLRHDLIIFFVFNFSLKWTLESPLAASDDNRRRFAGIRS